MNKQYLVIRDGIACHTETLSQKDLNDFKTGQNEYIQIFDISDPTNPLERYILDIKWLRIDKE